MRGLGVFALILSALLLGFALLFPSQLARAGTDDIARLVYLLAFALLIGGGVMSAIGGTGGRASAGGRISLGRAVLYLAIWGGIILLLFLAPRAFEWISAALDPSVRT